ncbi:hypothetical protein [Acrocarpospora catenulata]|uniref:pPIWI_RE_Z domain-containing protein n=1 Tax=Acrocarpospora catenulata TaxID=2836182 RepID=UPI001BDB6050|nr:hypothetical protein [Acrocarpospora catenulata]
MRDRESWHRPVSRELGRVWNGLPAALQGMKPIHLCQVELAIRLLQRLAPREPAEGAHTLLGGYPFARAAGLVRTIEHDTMLIAARHLLWTLRRRRAWHQALELYRQVPARLRAYEVPEDNSPVLALTPTVASDRIAFYDDALARLPQHARKPLPLAPAGRSGFMDRRRPTSVTIPEELIFDPATGHDLAKGRPGGSAPLTIERAELLATAIWMDQRERELDVERPGNWEDRLSELRFAPRDADGRNFSERDDIHLNGLMHLVGMVGAGKSTLMVLVAVYAARRDLRVTLVVGDVAEQLRLCELLSNLDLPAVPVLGPTTRETHVQRLHRRLASRGLDNLLDHDATGFDDLSTACVVDALRSTEAIQPLRYADAPCTALYPEKRKVQRGAEIALPEPYQPGEAAQERAADELRGAQHGCPVWARCPRHRAARNLVQGLIWVANPASLVQSAVPQHLNEEQLRYLELACLLSDIVIVDEADSVQMKLDEIFAPSATLVRPGPESWLDQLHTHKIEELSRRGRLPLTDQEIERWNSALTVVSAATDRLYRLLIAEEELRDWADIEYFSPWTLQEKLLGDWFDEQHLGAEGVPDERQLYEPYDGDPPEVDESSTSLDSLRSRLRELLDTFRDDPLGDSGPYDTMTDDLVDTTRDLLHTLHTARTRARVRALLDKLIEGTPASAKDDRWRDLTCRRLEFLLVLSALHQRLERLTFLWPQVEAALRLDSTGNELARRPPLDYAPLIPEAPMGNVLGFQYLPDERERDEDGNNSGTLRFFRCAGVGRELLLSLHELGADPGQGRPGPHVVLMSGTSWSGASTRAHVLASVAAVLMPSERSLNAVGKSRFATRFLYDADGAPMRLSGTDPRVRPAAARALAMRLGSPGRGGGASPLEEELALVRDDNRRRAILLVGSYKEANTVADTLHGLDRWRGRVRVLAADDADLDHSVRGTDAAGAEHAVTLRRGDLAMFAEDPDAELLVAPLLAVERGHNILNIERNAAFGTALFLARPHPRPDDLTLAIFAVNDWVCRFVRDQKRPDNREGPATFSELVAKATGLDRAGLDFRHEARQEWRRLLSRRYVYSRLSPWEKHAFAWDQLVTMWQVIGRLVRGGVPARVVFVDASFAPRLARALSPGSAGPAPLEDGLLAALRSILVPYFATGADPASFPDPADPALAQLLYKPLYNALSNLEHHR